jgi:hypothetical protein
MGPDTIGPLFKSGPTPMHRWRAGYPAGPIARSGNREKLGDGKDGHWAALLFSLSNLAFQFGCCLP